MGCGNQPVFTAQEEGKDECYSTNKPSGADGGGWNHDALSLEDEIVSFPFASLGYDQCPLRDIQDDGYSYMPDLNCTVDPKIDESWANSKRDFSRLCRDYEMPPPELSMKGDGDDYLISPALLSTGYGKPEIPTSFTSPRREDVTSYPIKMHGAEAQNSRITRFQMSGQLSSPRCSTSLLPLVDNLGARGDRNDISTVPIFSSSPQNNDRNFLTLGTGGSTKFRRNSNFSTREISSKLEEVSSKRNSPIVGPCHKNLASLTQLTCEDARIQAQAGGVSGPDSNFSARKVPTKLQEVSSQFNNSSRYSPKNPLSLDQLSGGDARFQTNSGGLSVSNSNFSAQETFASELDGVYFQSNDPIVGNYPKNPLNLAQTVDRAGTIQANACGLVRPACNSTSSVTNCAEGGLIRDEGFRLNSNPFPGLHTLQTNIPYNTPSTHYTSASEPTPMSLPCGSTIFSQTNCNSQPQVTSTYLASHPISWQQDYLRNSSINMSSESNRNYLSHLQRRSSTGHVQPGNLSLAAEVIKTEGDKIGSFPSNVRPVGKLEAFHHTIPMGVPGNYVSYKKTGIQLSKRSNYQPAAAGFFPKRLGLQPNDVATAQSVRGQYQHGVSTQSSAAFSQVDNSNGQVVPIANSNDKTQVTSSISRPPLRRKAVADPSALSGQRRKIIPPPVISDSTPQQKLSIPTIRAPIPAVGRIPPEPLYVKWKGFEEKLEPSEKRCLLCKRNLSFTAEGLMYQPTAPPPVAVLPCGHTFHDHCLQIITPEDQSKNPPCIPCAVGET